MATTQKLPSGSWRCRLFIDGKQKSFTAATKKEAEQKAYAFLESHPSAQQIRDGKATVGAVLAAHVEAKAGTISPTTLISYNRIQRLYFDDIKDKRVCDLTPTQLQASVSALASTLSPKTVRNAYGLLHSALSPYVRSDLFKTVTLPQKVTPDIRIPTSKETETIIKYFKGTRYELPLSIAAFCGLRREEICALTIGDFDRENKTLSVNKALVNVPAGGTKINKTKTEDSKRTVFCPDRVLALLPDGKPSDRIYTGGIHNIYKSLQACFPKLGIEPFRLHDFRHFYCSTLIRLSIPTFYIRKALGHSSEKMIQTVYAHIMDEGTKEFNARINDEFSKK